VPLRYENPQWGINFGYRLIIICLFLTNLFLHASWGHLIVNMWFLWIFADNVEDRMGRLPFLVFYLLCGIFASVLQWYFDPILDIPGSWASGAIAGVLALFSFFIPLNA